MAPRRI